MSDHPAALLFKFRPPCRNPSYISLRHGPLVPGPFHDIAEALGDGPLVLYGVKLSSDVGYQVGSSFRVG